MKDYYSKCYARYKDFKTNEINRVPEEEIYKAANYFIALALREKITDRFEQRRPEVWYQGRSLKKAKRILLTKGKSSFLCGWFDLLKLIYCKKEKGVITRIGCCDYTKIRV